MSASARRQAVDDGPELTGSPFDPATTSTGRRKETPGLALRFEIKDKRIPSDAEKFERFLAHRQDFIARSVDGYLRQYRDHLLTEREASTD